jgi:NDP-sugar pyrophosphorylase family protein
MFPIPNHVFVYCGFSEQQEEFKNQWQQFFSQLHPMCLPVGNQPLILWVLEALAKARLTTVTLIDPYLKQRPELHQQLKEKARSIYGFSLNFTDHLANIPAQITPVLSLAGVNLHVYDPDTQQIQSQALRHLKDYYHENMRSASHWQHYVTLPYFKRVGQVSMGERCKIHNRSLCRQSILGKHVVLSDESQAIGSIIGDYAHLGPQTQVFGSIVLPHTRLGSHLHVLGKIVSGNFLIDPLSGAWTTMDPVWCRVPKHYAL